MAAIDSVNPSRVSPEDFLALIEISKGSKMKYELDKETGYLILDRVLFTSTHYPANYGLIPRTLAADGDHLEFRYCSKCNGNYEFCLDHLFTHEHIK